MGSATAFRLIPGFLVGVYRIYLQVFWFPSTAKNIHIGLRLNLAGGLSGLYLCRADSECLTVSTALCANMQKTVHITKISVSLHSICT